MIFSSRQNVKGNDSLDSCLANIIPFVGPLFNSVRSALRRTPQKFTRKAKFLLLPKSSALHITVAVLPAFNYATCEKLCFYRLSMSQTAENSH